LEDEEERALRRKAEELASNVAEKWTEKEKMIKLDENIQDPHTPRNEEEELLYNIVKSFGFTGVEVRFGPLYDRKENRTVGFEWEEAFSLPYLTIKDGKVGVGWTETELRKHYEYELADPGCLTKIRERLVEGFVNELADAKERTQKHLASKKASLEAYKKAVKEEEQRLSRLRVMSERLR
jgi:hypothetical protein